jgi:single-strand DNA-binding protein
MMGMSWNQVAVGGNLTRDIEIKYMPNGMAVCDISLAVNERRKSGNEYIDEVSYVDCTAFGKTAEVMEKYLGKGSSVLIGGKLKQERWQDKDGHNRSRLKVIVERMQMIGSRSESNADAVQSDQLPASTTHQQVDDDIPF